MNVSRAMGSARLQQASVGPWSKEQWGPGTVWGGQTQRSQPRRNGLVSEEGKTDTSEVGKDQELVWKAKEK